MQEILSRLKLYCRWLILGGTLFFLAKAFKDNWHEVAAIRITGLGWATLAIALGVTLFAHIWSAWVWTWILDELNQPVPNSQFVQVYLKTNIAKYLPGNIWHFYGRIFAAKNAGVKANVATLSVLLEPLLMAASALIVTLLSIEFIAISVESNFRGLLVFVLATVLIALHPRFLNLAVSFFSRLKFKSTSNTVDTTAFQVKRYPWRPILGELGFVGLRSAGFLLTILALTSVETSQIPLLIGAFSLAWLLGLVIPGAPGGLGVFEVTAIALLQQSFSPGWVISAIALYRLVSILAEALGAGLAWLDEQRLR